MQGTSLDCMASVCAHTKLPEALKASGLEKSYIDQEDFMTTHTLFFLQHTTSHPSYSKALRKP